jgi:hypothetical protein
LSSGIFKRWAVTQHFIRAAKPRKQPAEQPPACLICIKAAGYVSGKLPP